MGLWWWFTALVAGFWLGLLGCVGVVCELDSVFVCFLCLFFVFEYFFWLGLPAFVVGFPGLLFLQFCSESLILAQDERWRRA